MPIIEEIRLAIGLGLFVGITFLTISIFILLIIGIVALIIGMANNWRIDDNL